MGRRNKVASDLHLQRNKRGTRLYSKDDFREHYCITSKQLDVLERARGSGLFGCLSNYHVSSAYERHCTNTSAKLLFSLALYSRVHLRAVLYPSKQMDFPKCFVSFFSARHCTRTIKLYLVRHCTARRISTSGAVLLLSRLTLQALCFFVFTSLYSCSTIIC